MIKSYDKYKTKTPDTFVTNTKIIKDWYFNFEIKFAKTNSKNLVHIFKTKS